MTYPGPVVSVEWLAARFDASDIVIVDATVHLPDTGRDAESEYQSEHIPGARFFDLGIIADPDNPLPRKVPPRELFARKVGEIGISNDKHVVAYDTPGLYSAARVWWLFRLYGYDNVSILDGGLKAWKSAGRPTQSGPVAVSPAGFTPGRTRDHLVRWPQVLEAVRDGGQILDARTPGRFAGTEVDRYPGARKGHIPNSINLYWADLLDPESRCLLPTPKLRDRFTQAGLSLDTPVTLSCGSGLTACILALGLHLMGKNDWCVYDGSWDEWGRNHDLPVAAES